MTTLYDAVVTFHIEEAKTRTVEKVKHIHASLYVACPYEIEETTNISECVEGFTLAISGATDSTKAAHYDAETNTLTLHRFGWFGARDHSDCDQDIVDRLHYNVAPITIRKALSKVLEKLRTGSRALAIHREPLGTTLLNRADGFFLFADGLFLLEPAREEKYHETIEEPADLYFNIDVPSNHVAVKFLKTMNISIQTDLLAISYSDDGDPANDPAAAYGQRYPKCLYISKFGWFNDYPYPYEGRRLRNAAAIKRLLGDVGKECVEAALEKLAFRMLEKLEAIMQPDEAKSEETAPPTNATTWTMSKVTDVTLSKRDT